MNGLEIMKKRIRYYGDSVSADQWTRMREDKLKSLKKALYYSYQAAIVQEYTYKEDPEGPKPYFRCLINHDKLKVDYEDKIISIPFKENSVIIDPVQDNADCIETNFHNGTCFKWIHGNNPKWIQDSYWIVYMQYSEETAYFRGEIRKADQEIEITRLGEDDEELETLTYRGWTTGPDEKSIKWNLKKGVSWNDLNYTKILYISKDENTSAFFKRFDRVLVNGQPWEVQGYNDSLGSSSDSNTGILKVALKETYKSTSQEIQDQKKQEESAEPAIIGPDALAPYDTDIKYTVINGDPAATWEIEMCPSTLNASDYLVYWDDGEGGIDVSIITTKSYKKGFNIKYGDLVKHVTIKSL